MKRVAIILMGGQTRRMGQPKAWLPFGDETLLERIARILAKTTDHTIVVSALDQAVPKLSFPTTVVHDEQPDRGPLEGIQAGLRAAQDLGDLCYISSCDVPLLEVKFVEKLFHLLSDEHDIVVPRDDKFFHPLAAVYRTCVLPTVEQLLKEDKRRPFFLFEQARTKIVPTSELRDVDPKLSSLRNLNTSEEYAAALQELGYDSTTR